MNFYEIIKSGYITRIEDNRISAVGGFYDPAEFWMKDGELYSWCPEIGVIKANLSETEINEHFEQMLSIGLDVTIKHTKLYRR